MTLPEFMTLTEIFPTTIFSVKIIHDCTTPFQSEAEGGEGEDIVDSEGEVVGFENLVFAIFDYVHALVDNPKLEGAVKAGLTDLMFYVIVFMQMTDEQIEKWTENPDKFVEDEDEDSFTYSVRISSQVNKCN